MSDQKRSDYGQTPEEAVQRSQRILQAVQAQGPEVSRLSTALRTANQRNHFAERIEESMRRAQR